MKQRKESAQERIERMRREKEAAKAAAPTAESSIVEQLNHDSDGELDFTSVVEKLKERKEQEARGENEGYQKMTIYIRNDIADSFNALITKRGQQKKYANIALADFVKKKIRELGME